MRIMQSGGELGRTWDFTNGINWTASTAQKTGVGSDRSITYNLGNLGTSSQRKAYLTLYATYENSNSLDRRYYYKSDIYVDALPADTTFKVFPICFGDLDSYQVLSFAIVNDGGTLKLITKINNSDYSTTTLGVNFDEWFRFEVGVDIWGGDSNPGRNLTVRVNGSDLINMDLPGLSSTSPTLMMGALNDTGVSQNWRVYFDNIAMNDNTGSFNNSWIGEETIVLLRVAGAGDSNATVGDYNTLLAYETSTGIPAPHTGSVSNYLQLDDATTQAWFTMADPTNIIHSYDNVTAVSVPLIIREETSTTTSYQTGIKSASGGTTQLTTAADAGGTSWLPSPSGVTPGISMLFSDSDPSTSLAWKVRGTNSLTNSQIGVLSLTANDIWVGYLGANVAYTTGTPPPATDGMMIMFW